MPLLSKGTRELSHVSTHTSNRQVPCSRIFFSQSVGNRTGGCTGHTLAADVADNNDIEFDVCFDKCRTKKRICFKAKELLPLGMYL